jgi:hypothetical protein
MLTVRKIGTFKGTEPQAMDLGFNVATGYHDELFIHINFNSSRDITFTKEGNSPDFSLEEKFIERKMKKLIEFVE